MERSTERVRSVLLEHRLGVGVRTVADVCDKYGLTPRGFRRLRREGGHPRATRRDLVLAGVYGGGRTIEALRAYCDHRDHERPSEAEVQDALEGLRREGLVVPAEDGWRAVRETSDRHLFVSR